jgi:transposase
MDRYIGLDVHSQTCTLAVMGASGRRLKEQIVETNGKVLVDFMKATAGARHVCLEEGTHSEWLYELLKPHVDEIVVVQPWKSDGPKSDSIDAWALAERIRTGVTRGAVFKAPGVYAELRAAVRAHQALVEDVVRAKNRLKAIFRSRGIQATSAEIYSPSERSKWVEMLPSHRRKLATLLGAELDALQQTKEESEQWLLQEARRCATVRLLETAPGIGIIRAAQIVAIVISPNRFRRRQQFWSYCGLAIVFRSSSDWKRDHHSNWSRKDKAQTRGLNQNRHPLLKMIFKGAAQRIERMPGHVLHKDYERLIEAGIKPNLARLTIARKIASTVLAMWKNKEEYDPAKTSSQPRAA